MQVAGEELHAMRCQRRTKRRWQPVRVVLDMNMVLSAVISRVGPPREIVMAWVGMTHTRRRSPADRLQGSSSRSSCACGGAAQQAGGAADLLGVVATAVALTGPGWRGSRRARCHPRG